MRHIDRSVFLGRLLIVLWFGHFVKRVSILEILVINVILVACIPLMGAFLFLVSDMLSTGTIASLTECLMI